MNENRFPDRLLLPLAFDAGRLAADMASFAQTSWIEHFVKQNYDGDWSVIPLRGPAGATHPIRMIYSDPACTHFEDTPMLAGSPYFREVLATFTCPLHAVRLMRLTPRLGHQGAPRQRPVLRAGHGAHPYPSHDQ